jgi:DNA-binding HxlR family transcriptional regulator
MSIETNLTCPVNRAIAALADKWKILIILTLQERTIRYGELLRALDGIAPKVMARQLRSLEKDGLVQRTAYAEVPPRVEYSLTRAGRTLLPVLNDLQRWVIENAEQLSIDITGHHDPSASNNEGATGAASAGAIRSGESLRTFPTALLTGR